MDPLPPLVRKPVVARPRYDVDHHRHRLAGLAAIVWMVIEARRLEIGFVWIYVIVAFVVAISVTFPIFLFVCERRLQALGVAHREASPTAADLAGLAIFGVPIVLFAAYTLFHDVVPECAGRNRPKRFR